MKPSSPRPIADSRPEVVAAATDRRSQPRLSAETLGLEVDARLSPGVPVRLVNVSSGGALLELQEWIRPGTRSELRLSKSPGNGETERLTANGHIARCWVQRLSPLCYRAALVFSAQVAVSADTTLDDDLMVLLERPA